MICSDFLALVRILTLCEFIYSSNLHPILNKCFAGISLILKSKAAGVSNAIYAQCRTEIQDLIKHNSIAQRIVKEDFSKTFQVYLFFPKLYRPENCCFKIPWIFPGFLWLYEPWMWRSGTVIQISQKYRCGQLAGGSFIWSCTSLECVICFSMAFWIQIPTHPCISHSLHSLEHKMYFHDLPDYSIFTIILTWAGICKSWGRNY